MRNLTWLAALLGGCIFVDSSPTFNHQGGVGGGVPVSAQTYRISPGASTIVYAGRQAGYGLSANTGGSYRLVWTGDGAATGSYREFWGSVYTAGTFSNVVPGCNAASCSLESDDYVSSPVATSGGQRIDFDSIAASGLNGFDFVATNPVYFDFLIDGSRYPNLVFFPATDNGGQISNVGTIPFGLTTQ